MLRLLHVTAVISLPLILSGCGTVVPDLQEFWGSSDNVLYRKVALLHQVQCELGRSLEKQRRQNIAQGLPFLNKWAADVLMQLTIEEKSSASPSIAINGIVPNAITQFSSGATLTTPQTFSTSLGIAGSADGYRQEKVHVPYRVDDLTAPFTNYTPEELARETCIPTQRSKGFLIDMQDLKIDEWVQTDFELQRQQQADFKTAGKAFSDKGVLSDDIKFEVVSSGSVNPTWKLLRTSGNSGSNPFFMASRDRTQELIITLGPEGDRFERSVATNELAGALNNITKFNNP